MRILDKNNVEITNPNLSKGYLKFEHIVTKHHDAVESTAGVIEGWKVIHEYENGGKDVEPVYSEEPVEAKPAYDETEEIQRYIPYTADELEKITKAN